MRGSFCQTLQHFFKNRRRYLALFLGLSCLSRVEGSHHARHEGRCDRSRIEKSKHGKASHRLSTPLIMTEMELIGQLPEQTGNRATQRCLRDTPQIHTARRCTFAANSRFSNGERCCKVISEGPSRPCRCWERARRGGSKSFPARRIFADAASALIVIV